MPLTLAGLLLVALSAGAVGTTQPPDTQPPVTGPAASGASPEVIELPEGVHVAVEFPRYLMIERRLEAIIDNQSDVDVTIVDVALRSPLFEPADPDLHDYIVAALRAGATTSR